MHVVCREVIEALNAEAIHQAQDDERDNALRRRWLIEEAALRVLQAQRLLPYGFVGLQITQAHRAACFAQVGVDHACEFALVVIVQARAHQLLQRGSHPWLEEQFTRLRQLARHQKGVGKSGLMLQAFELVPGVVGLAGGNRDTALGVMNRIAQEPRQA